MILVGMIVLFYIIMGLAKTNVHLPDYWGGRDE